MCERDLDVATARRVLDRVGDEVEKELPQAVRIAEHGRVFTSWQLDRETGLFAKDYRGLEDITYKRLEAHRLAMKIVSPLVGPGEGEQTLNEIGHPRRLLQCFLERDH